MRGGGTGPRDPGGALNVAPATTFTLWVGLFGAAPDVPVSPAPRGGHQPRPGTSSHPGTWSPAAGGGLRAVTPRLSPMPPTAGRGLHPPCHVGRIPWPGSARHPRGSRGRTGRGQRGQEIGGGSRRRRERPPQPCPISLELPPPGAPAMAMRMGSVRVFCTPLLLLLLFLSSACTQPLPTALGEQQSNLRPGRAAQHTEGGGGARRGGGVTPWGPRGVPWHLPTHIPGGSRRPGDGRGVPAAGPRGALRVPSPRDEPLVGLSSSRCPVWPCRCLKSPFLSDDQVFRWFSCAHEHSMRFPPVVDDPNKREMPPAAHIYARGRVPIYVCERLHACPRVPPRRAERTRAANQPIRSKSSQRGGRPAGTTASPFSLVTDAAGLFPCPLSLVCLSPF